MHANPRAHPRNGNISLKVDFPGAMQMDAKVIGFGLPIRETLRYRIGWCGGRESWTFSFGSGF